MEDEKIIHDRMITNISDDYDKSKGNFVYDVTKPVAVEFAKQQEKSLQYKKSWMLKN